MSYEYLYKLRPVREIEPNWYKLAWQPIRGGTWNLYTNRLWYHSIGVHAYLGGDFNGWGRYCRRLDIKFSLISIEVNFWLVWDIRVHKDGPFDQDPKRLLDLTWQPPNNRRRRSAPCPGKQ